MILIYYSPSLLDTDKKTSLMEHLRNSFPSIKEIEFEEVDEPLFAMLKPWNQIDVDLLLPRFLLERPERKIVLWLLKTDITAHHFNFIFGIGLKCTLAVVSTYRLRKWEMVLKEITHELGHVFGLSHCANECVMQYSNSLFEAIKKPMTFCTKCKKELEKGIIKCKKEIFNSNVEKS